MFIECLLYNGHNGTSLAYHTHSTEGETEAQSDVI